MVSPWNILTNSSKPTCCSSQTAEGRHFFPMVARHGLYEYPNDVGGLLLEDSILCILNARRNDCVPSVVMGRRPCFTIIPTLLVQRWLRWLSHAASRPDSDMIEDQLIPTPTLTWHMRNGGQLSNCDRGRPGEWLRMMKKGLGESL